MSQALLDLIAQWDGESVVVRHDRPTGTWIFIALHSSVLGRPTGGTRMKVYPELADALRDAQRLGEGMTHKWAGTGFHRGGGKAVLALPGPLDDAAREGLLERYGALLHALSGAFATGPDLGTGTKEMAVIARKTRYVHGLADNGSVIDPGPFTARGVYGGLRAALGQVFDGERDVRGRTILVEGLGGVGAPLARRLAEDGARLMLADLDAERANAFAAELDARIVPPEEVPETECDVYAPCAVGATLNARTIPLLKCRIVAGSANNQLDEAQDAERLRERDILYVPDYIINSGGAIAFFLLDEEHLELGDVLERVATLEERVAELLAEAEREGISPLVASRRQVDRLLQDMAKVADSGISE